VLVVGSFQGWDAKTAIQLTTGSSTYPQWQSLIFNLGHSNFEYKYIITKDTQLLWEEGQNRTISLTAGSFTITDENFGQTKIKAKVNTFEAP
jgi:hypothetical protein